MDVSPPPPPAAPYGDYSLRRYLREAFEVLTNADSRLLRTFRMLVTRPGALAAACFSPERDEYLRPQQVLLLCSVFYFFAQPLVGFSAGFSAPLRVQLGTGPFADWVRARIQPEVLRRDGDLEAYAALFDVAASAHARTLAFLVVPLVALLLTGLFWRPRRFFVEHLVFATHFVSFLMLVVPAVALVVLKPFSYMDAGTGLPSGMQGILTDLLPMLTLLMAYLYPALRRAYGHGPLLAAGKAAALTVGMIYVVVVYRLILVLVTFYGM